MKRMLRWSLVVLALAVCAMPAGAREVRDQLPDDNCTSCLCTRSHCLYEAGRLYFNCDSQAVTTSDFFGCATAYDLDRAGCGFEFYRCIFFS